MFFFAKMNQKTFAPARLSRLGSLFRGCFAELLRVELAAFLVTGISNAAAASDAGHDPRPLTSQENATFVPLLCSHPRKILNSTAYNGSNAFRCVDLVGYETSGRGQTFAKSQGTEISFTSIALGSFTTGNADEAYVSYHGGFESHATGFGGGVLFTRKSGEWHLVSWRPSRQMDGCQALPSKGRGELLCLRTDGWADERYSRITIDSISSADNPDIASLSNSISPNDKPLHVLSRELLAVVSNMVGECPMSRPPRAPSALQNTQCPTQAGAGFLLWISDLKHSGHLDAFAEATVIYNRPHDIETACQKTCYHDAVQRVGRVYFVLDGDTVKVVMPENLNLQSVFDSL